MDDMTERTEQEKTAFEFEAILCEVAAVSIEVKAMEAANKEADFDGFTVQYSEQYFKDAASAMREFARKLRALKGG